MTPHTTSAIAGGALPDSARWADFSVDPDPQLLRAALQRALVGPAWGDAEIDAVRVFKARRSSSAHRDPHPIRFCMAFDLRDAATGAPRTLQLYAKAFRGGASASAFRLASAVVVEPGFAPADRAALAQPADGSPFCHLPELDMLVWAWPNDPSLPQLARLLDVQRLAAHLPATVEAGSAGGPGCAVQRIDVLRYEPERRATLRCTLAPEPGQAQPRVLYAKTFRDDNAKVLLQRFEFFWKLSQHDANAPAVAQPLGWDAATRTFWQCAAPGVPLRETLDQGDADPGAPLATFAPFARIGRALARLHSATLPVSANRSTSFWIHEAQLRAKKIGRVLPHLEMRAQSLANLLERGAADLPPAHQTLIHGDFHPDQVWLAEDRVVFFDFDEFAIGNPMEDLAEFVVKFEQGRDVQPQARARRASQIKFLIEGYRERAPQWFDAAWLQWHCAVQTLLQASRAFIYQQPGWREQLESRLDASQALASTAVFEVAAW